jgi:hypothetical protein
MAMSSIIRWRSGLTGPAGISSFIVRLLRLKEPKCSARDGRRSIQAERLRRHLELTTSATPAQRVRAPTHLRRSWLDGDAADQRQAAIPLSMKGNSARE